MERKSIARLRDQEKKEASLDASRIQSFLWIDIDLPFAFERKLLRIFYRSVDLRFPLVMLALCHLAPKLALFEEL